MIPSLQLVAYEPPDPERMAWQDRGACRGVDPDVFFPGPKQNARAAKKICAECDADVRAECLAYAIDNEPLGVWGGMSPRERLAVRTEPMSKASRFAARCGTVGGRSAHQRRNELPCDACRDAYNEHERAKALRRRLAEGRG